MHYYQFNIGDYKSHTEHLSEMEDLTYRRLLDWYYLHETPIPLDLTETARQIRMRSHSDCIALVLQEYFERTDDGWIHHRANAEILKAGDKSQKASESAKARWNKKVDANALQTQSESNATHNTQHITQDTQHKEKAKPPYQALFDVFWNKYPKKVGKDAALKAFQKRKPDQHLLVQMLNALGEQSRSEAWVKDGGQFVPNPATWLNQGRWQDEVTNFKPVDLIHQTTPTPPNQDAALRKIEEDSKKASKPNAEVQARIAELLKNRVV
jgi:uncharacterized protein YdaU (DUF1376 family)